MINTMSNYFKRFPRRNFLGDREKFLIRAAKDKVVVHIGCTDWPNQIAQIRRGKLLHTLLIEGSKSVIGVDIDSEGIRHFQNEMPFQSFIIGDIATSKETQNRIIDLKPELLLIPDVIEHIEDSRSFLRAVRTILNETGARAIITTPNAFAIKTYLPVLIGFDVTHVDHCSFHNEFTLEHSLKDAQFNDITIGYLSRNISARYGVITQVLALPFNYLAKLFPRFGDTLVATISV